MLDLLLKAADKFVDLLKYRQARDDRQFSLLVEPTFQSLVAVHKDYLEMFLRLQMRVNSRDELKDAISQLRVVRVAHEAGRHALFTQCNELLGEDGLRKFHPFFASVVAYFRPVDIRVWNTPSMKLLQMLEAASPKEIVIDDLSFTHTDGTRRYHFDELIEKHTSQLRERWSAVCKNYARAMADANA